MIFARWGLLEASCFHRGATQGRSPSTMLFTESEALEKLNMMSTMSESVTIMGHPEVAPDASNFVFLAEKSENVGHLGFLMFLGVMGVILHP